MERSLSDFKSPRAGTDVQFSQFSKLRRTMLEREGSPTQDGNSVEE
jgi:hypothetical protein